MKHLGFTGTGKADLASPQKAVLFALLRMLRREYDTLHHGDCIHADEQCDWIARRLTEPYHITIHPPFKDDKRAFCQRRGKSTVLRPRGYIDRNRDIVRATQTLAACPRLMWEERRSGTWATVRFARRMGLRIYIVWPDGTVTQEGVNGAA